MAGYFDGKGIYRERGTGGFDAKGIYREPNEGGFDYSGTWRDSNDGGIDSSGTWRDHDSPGIDGAGYWSNPWRAGSRQFIICRKEEMIMAFLGFSVLYSIIVPLAAFALR